MERKLQGWWLYNKDEQTGDQRKWTIRDSRSHKQKYNQLWI
jgi:hypothetical protein